MKVINTSEPQFKPSVVMMVYGEGGVGKTTFAATAPKPILADCENGAKYFGLRGIHLDVAQIQNWSDMNFENGFGSLAKLDKYDTVIIDPIGELMEKLKAHMIKMGDRKLVQADGSPSMAGWGWLKDTMRAYINILRDLNKHVLIIAHVEERADEDRLVKRPLIQTKISNDLVNMVDIVGYMGVTKINGEAQRIIYVDPSSDKFTCKDRTGQLGTHVEPDFQKIIKAVQGTETYSWSKSQQAKAQPEDKPATAPKRTTRKKSPVASELPPVSTDEGNTTALGPAPVTAPQGDPRQPSACPNCRGPITPAEISFSTNRYGQALCRNCQSKVGQLKSQ